MLTRHLAAALIANLASELGGLILGCPCAAFYCPRDVCRLYHLGSRPRPCRVLCRPRSCVWGVFSFCRILCLRCGSCSRTLSVLFGPLIHSARSLLHLPSCWL